MNSNLKKILLWLQDKAIIEDADLGRLIVNNCGIQRRTILQYHDFLTENKIVYRIGERKYRVNRKLVRRYLAGAEYTKNAS